MNSASVRTRTHIRWMIRLDLPAMFEIEARSFPCPWTEEDFLACLRGRNTIGMVAEQGERRVGFMIYELHADRLELVSLAVHPDFRRMRIGSLMIGKLVENLSSHRRAVIEANVGESNLDAHLFFRDQGFVAVGVDRGFYGATGEDAYRMEYRLSTEGEQC